MFNDPSVVNSRIGEYAPDGSLLHDANVCFVTGKRIQPGDVTLRLGGTLFIRIQASVFRNITAGERQAIEAQALEEAARTKVQAAPGIVTPDYDSMSLDDLKALAEQRQIDTEGARSKSQLVARLRMADVRERFATPSAILSEGETESTPPTEGEG